VGLDNWSGSGSGTASGNRWQGYSHQQLYNMLHSGPGPAAAGMTADRWSGMAAALSDIEKDISSGIAASGAAWVGAAADSAQGALNPLGQWAEQASSAADVMRISAELQGDLLSKARADMPVPIAIPQQAGQIGQLVTAQVDYEMAEAASQVGAQLAFQVMAQYEAGTTDNTNTLGDFGEPPSLHVDTTPITGVAVRGRIRVTQPPRRLPRTTPTAGRAAAAPVEEPTGTAGSSSTKAPVSPEPVSPAPVEEPGAPSPSPVAEPTGSAPAATEPTAPVTRGTTSSSASSSAPSSAQPEPGTAPSAAEPTAPSSATSAGSGITPGRAAGSTRDKSGASAAGATPRIGGMVPTARRPNAENDEDAEHESKYLIEAEDIYGDRRSYTPPVIGESRQHR
jgi:PPE family